MKAILVTLVTTGLLQLLQLGGSILSARLLLPDGRGELAAAQLWPTTIAYLLLLGLNDATLYFSANRRQPASAVFAAALWLGVGLSVLGMMAGWSVALPLAYAGYPADVRRLAGLMMLVIPCNILGTIFLDMLRGHQRTGSWNLMRLALPGCYLAIGLVLFVVGRADVLGFGVAFLVAQAVPMAWAIWLCVRHGWGGWRVPGATMRAMLGFGIRLHPSTVVQMVNDRIDQMLIQAVLLPAALGFYVVSRNLAQMTATLGSSVTMIAYPRACAAADHERGAVIGVYLRLTLLLVIAATAALFLVTPLVIRLLYGGEFAAAAPVVRILLVGVIPISIKDFYILAFKAFDRSLALSKAEAATLALNAGLLAWLVPAAGLDGAALAYVAVKWASAGYLGWLARRDLGLTARTLFVPTARDAAVLADGLARLRGRLVRST